MSECLGITNPSLGVRGEKTRENSAGSPVERGKYLATVGCGCHIPADQKGPLPGLCWRRGLEGTMGRGHQRKYHPGRLRHQLLRRGHVHQVMRTGYVKARKLSSIMPFGEFANLTDDDLKAIFAYLHSLPHVKTHSGQQPAANLLQTVPPEAWCRRTELTRKTVKDLTTVARSGAIIRCMRRQWAIAAVCAAALVGSLPAQMHGGGSRGGGSMGHGGFSSSRLPRRTEYERGSALRTGFGTGLRQPAFHSGLLSVHFAVLHSAIDISVPSFLLLGISGIFRILRIPGLLQRRLLLDGGFLSRL